MTGEPNPLEAMFTEGADARQAGLPLRDNPYALGTAEHREWAAGWTATLELDEENDPESTRVRPGKTDDTKVSGESLLDP